MDDLATDERAELAKYVDAFQRVQRATGARAHVGSGLLFVLF